MATAPNSEMTILIIGLTGAALFFGLQLLLCCKARPLWVKLSPVYLLILGALLCLGTYLGLFGTSSAGSISGNGLAAWILGAIVAIAGLGDGLAWAVYAILRAVQKRK